MTRREESEETRREEWRQEDRWTNKNDKEKRTATLKDKKTV